MLKSFLYLPSLLLLALAGGCGGKQVDAPFQSADGEKPLVNQEPAPVNQDTSPSKPGASTPVNLPDATPTTTAPSTMPPSSTSVPPPSNSGTPVLTCASVLCAPGTRCVDSAEGAQCVSRDPCQGFVCPKGEHCSAPADAPMCVPDEADPCASVTCQQGEQCVVQQVLCIQAPCPGIPSCVPACACTKEYLPVCGADGKTYGNACEARCATVEVKHAGACKPEASACHRTGCSGQICSDQDVASTCEYRPEYACYETAKCERQPTGACGFTPNEALKICLSNSVPAKVFCGGIAAFACPGGGTCVDDPSDTCSPKKGGADCGGVCLCAVAGDCKPGQIWNSSPSVCGCAAPVPQ